jgi:hypothetical protein
MDASEAEIDRQLAERPRDFEALIAKADLRSAAGDDRAAASFYKAALQSAAATGGPLPFAWKAPVERAQAAIASADTKFEEHLERHLARAGLAPNHRPPRFQLSLDLLTGRRHTQLQLQRPGAYFYPGLPQRRYYERSELPWAAAMEAAVPAILAELNAWLANGREKGFTPYVVSDPSRPRSDYHGLVDNPAWSTLYIWEKGGPIPELAAHFPRTLAAVGALDLPHIGVRAPSVLFSRLGPGARIPPHHGMLNARLICHLPLIVPPNCGFRVAGETRAWEAGKLLVFDDSVEHEAWNDSDQDRIILIFDIWRPELDGEERRAVTAMFEAIDSYGK